MRYKYETKGTCSRLIEVEDVIAKLKGVRCGMKSTSCPDQLATALTAVLEKQKNA